MTLEFCSHEIRDLKTVQGGTRQYPGGLLAFVAAVDEEAIAVTMASYDRAGLAAALRRAADEIEGVSVSPFNLEPVGETLEEYRARHERG